MIKDSILALTKADVRRKQEENQGREFEKRKSGIDDCESRHFYNQMRFPFYLAVSNSREYLSALNAVSFAMYSSPDFRA